MKTIHVPEHQFPVLPSGKYDFHRFIIQHQGLTVRLHYELAEGLRNSMNKKDWPFFQGKNVDRSNPGDVEIYLTPCAEAVRRRMISDISDLPDSWLVQIHQAIASKNADIRPLEEAEKKALTNPNQ